ncbi:MULTISPECIES: MFS transporter [unclassified Rhizobacter]|uniref:MFS transporter n=1 Tax=unclassified Rhizobacter TaxID=2640088 RepID=UPI0006F88E84|nr:MULTISPECIES: MFS transporter [unclassified Rhizobacter]KQU71256.1 arabinose ABC transporter permease [Rhizobacter sp. Root29]KQV97059.1 arabinose ABC transporter permease [Rhizobacter sp. Root1238]KRB24131.1 arabinose ABC transporter permease [Rhizobacter sp. Root16D2]
MSSTPVVPPPAVPPPVVPSTSAWAPLSLPVFRMLWGTWVAANVCMWMNDVAAAWLMTSLTTSPVLVALVQSASTLPVFLLGLPSGAMADILDRRRYFMLTQVWVAAVAVVTCATIAFDAMNAPLLLVLTFANGIGLAMRWPVFAAIVPELVPRSQLPSALALNGIAMNASRIIGPIVAGAIIASAGSAWVFVLNALLSIGAAFTISRWKREQKASTLPGERFLGAIRVGVQYVGQSARMHVVLLRVSIFFLQSTALLALLPLVAKRLHAGGAGTFTLLLASMGAGAIAAALNLPRIRRRLGSDELVRWGSFVQALAMVVVALAPSVAVAAIAMVAAGAAWISVANSLTVSAQLALPDWVRARGMSIYQMALMGSSAAGAALWGQVAAMTDVRSSLMGAAAMGCVALLLTRRVRLSAVGEEDLTPANTLKPPVTALPLDPHDGPVLIAIEYRIDPVRAGDFLQMMQERRSSCLRRGVLSWSLFRDTSDPALYVEQFVNESWAEHLRHFERMTVFDMELRERRLGFHVEQSPPKVSRYVAQGLGS